MTEYALKLLAELSCVLQVVLGVGDGFEHLRQVAFKHLVRVVFVKAGVALDREGGLIHRVERVAGGIDLALQGAGVAGIKLQAERAEMFAAQL